MKLFFWPKLVCILIDRNLAATKEIDFPGDQEGLAFYKEIN